MTRTFWTEKEDDLLKEYYCKENGKDMLKVLFPDKKRPQIVGRANYLGLKYHFPATKDELFFESPNPINCTIAAIIATDGTIMPRKNNRTSSHISIELQTRDTNLLQEIQSITKHTGNLNFRKPRFVTMPHRNPQLPRRILHSQGTTVLRVNSAEKWINDLHKNWNITPRKSLTLQAPNITEPEHILGYYCGSVTGDGWISIDNTTLRIALMGTYEFLTFFKQFFDSFMAIENPPVRIEKKDSKVFVWEICGMRAYLVTKMVLALDTLLLERKWSKAREHVSKIDQSEKLHTSTIKSVRSLITPQLLSYFQTHNIYLPEKFTINISHPTPSCVMPSDN